MPNSDRPANMPEGDVIAPKVGTSFHLLRTSATTFVAYFFVDGVFDGLRSFPYTLPHCDGLAFDRSNFLNAVLYTFDDELAAAVRAAGMEVCHVQ